jgi:hypothetical protein
VVVVVTAVLVVLESLLYAILTAILLQQQLAQ